MGIRVRRSRSLTSSLESPLRVAHIILVAAAGFVLATIPLRLAIASIAGIALVLMLLIQPATGLWILPFTVPFGSIRKLPLAGYGVGATEALIGLTLAAWLARGVAQRRLQLKSPPLLVPLLLLLGAMLLSVTSVHAVAPAVKELVKWSEILIVYVLVVDLVDDRRTALILAGTLLLAGSLSALHGLAGSLLRIGPPQFAILGGRLYRAFGTFGQPNPFGGYMNHSLPIAASLLAATLMMAAKENGEGKMEGGRWKVESGKWKMEDGEWRVESQGSQNSILHPPSSILHPPSSPYVCGLALTAISATLATGLVLSWSRGAWLGAAAGLATVALVWLMTLFKDEAAETLRRRAGALVWVGVAVLLIFMLVGGLDLLPASITARIDSAVATFTTLDARGADITNANFATLERIAHWQAAWSMWRDHFWTGVGIGNYKAAYSDYGLPKWPYALGHAHNIYFNMAAEIGFAGLLAYLIFIGAAAWHACKVARESSDLWGRGLAAGVLGVIVALAVHNAFDNMYVHAMGVHLAIALALVSALGRRNPLVR